MYCSHDLFCLPRVWLRGCLYVDVVSSSIDGEPFVGDQECFGNPDKKTTLIKASIAWDPPYCPIHHNNIIHYACVYLDRHRNYPSYCYPVPWYLWVYALGRFMLVLYQNYDIASWLMDYAMVIKDDFLATRFIGRGYYYFVGALGSP